VGSGILGQKASSKQGCVARLHLDSFEFEWLELMDSNGPDEEYWMACKRELWLEKSGCLDQ
jgi:hypothetical protein